MDKPNSTDLFIVKNFILFVLSNHEPNDIYTILKCFENQRIEALHCYESSFTKPIPLLN